MVVSNLTRAEVNSNHAVSSACWLTGVPPKRTDGPDFRVGVSVDQVIARQIGQDTTFPSLEVATEDFTGLVGACDPGYSCAYMNTLNWQTETTPLPMEINPRVVFERMFGSGGTADDRLARMRTDRSLLDFVADDLKQLEAGLGAGDRTRLDEYLAYVREIERRIQRAEQRAQTDAGRAERAGRRARILRGARGADVRPAGAGVPDRPDARLHVHDGARSQPADLSGHRRHRAASLDLAPRQPSGGDRRDTPS